MGYKSPNHHHVSSPLNQMFNPFMSGPIKGSLANSVDPDQMLQNAASDQYLHCLH